MPPLKLPPSEIGCRAHRSCTDLPMFIFFILCWALLIFLALSAYKSGDPNRLLYGTDKDGNVCGHGDPPKEFQPISSLSSAGNHGYINNNSNSISARKSQWQKRDILWYPFAYDPWKLEFVVKDALKLGVCVERCPNKGDTPPSYSDLDTWVYPVMFDSVRVLNRCMPKIISFNCSSLGSYLQDNCTNARDTTDIEVFDDAVEFFREGMGELEENIIMVVVAACLSIVISFLWLFILRRTVKPVVVLTIIIILGVLAAFGVLLWNRHTDLLDKTPPDNETARYYMAASIVVFIFLFLLLCLIMFLGKDIMIACDIIEEASKVPISIPFMAILPVLGLIAIVPICLFNGSIAVYIQASGTLDNPFNLTAYSSVVNTTLTNSVTLYKYDDWRIPAHIFNLFMFLWSLSFISSMVFLCVALCAVFWYWSQPGDGKDPPGDSVRLALFIAFRYHVGTVASGSLLIAIFKLIRIVMSMCEERFRSFTGPLDAGDQSVGATCGRFVFACTQCCLACFERFVKLINAQAYVMCAMTGERFLSAAQHGVGLLMANAISAGAVTIVGEWVMFFGKVIIVAISTFVGHILLITYGDVEDANGVICLTFVILLTYAVACVFINILSGCIDAILLSYCYDMESRDGNYYFPSDLAKHMEGARARAIARGHTETSNMNNSVNKSSMVGGRMKQMDEE
eukprot:PhM_4_TR12246/c0_g1_i1/m.48810/K15377/SLC44A2_4_5; solute carrier family 44 (choline transporter-like protein), member 2/4/5